MTRVLFIIAAVLVAGGVAFWMEPDALDEIGMELDQIGEEMEAVTMPEAPAQPEKDTSRVSTPSTSPPQADQASGEPDVGVLDLTSLPFETGCGLVLTREGEEETVFVDASSDEISGVMRGAMSIDGELVIFERSTADGEPLGFGQYPRQVFDSADNTVRVVIEVDLGEADEPEDVPVTAGEVTVMKAGQPTLKFQVSGGAGC